MQLRAALLCLCILAPAYTQTVTDTKWVDNWEVKDHGREQLRKINGRWWSEDNREVYPPASKDQFFWTLDSKPGVVLFNHHRPFQLERAESLHLWMTPPEVEGVLGEPNRVFGADDHAFWYYYAANGTKLSVRFMGDGVLGEANYTAVGEKSRPVASIESELAGRNIYTLLAERATQRLDQQSPDRYASRVRPRALLPRARVAQPSVLTVVASSDSPEPTAPKRTISPESLAAVKAGLARQELIDQLGEPTYRSAIDSDEGTRESLIYTLIGGEQVVIHVVNGKVMEDGRP